MKCLTYKRIVFYFSLFAYLCFVGFGCKPTREKNDASAIVYPETYKDTRSWDTFWSTPVPNPYKWLENADSPAVKEWVKSENKLTDDYFEKIPYVDNISERLRALWDYTRYSAPFKEGKYMYYYKNDGLQNYSVLYRKLESAKTEEVFLDPNTFSADATTSLANLSFTRDGNLVAYSISEGGADWQKIIVMDAQTKKIIDDTIRNVKFSGIAWKGNEGFFYSSYDDPQSNPLIAKTASHKLYYHRIGKPQSQDALVFGDGKNNTFRYISGGVSEDELYLIISASNSTYGNRLYIKKLSDNSPIKEIINNENNEYEVVFSKGDSLFILTDYSAPNKKLMFCSYKNPSFSRWATIIPEKNMPLDISTGGNYLFASYKKDASSVVMQYDLKGSLIKNIPLPGEGSLSGFSGKKEDKELYYVFSNHITPPSIYRYDLSSLETKLYIKPSVKFSPEDFTSEKVFYASSDGTKIPMTISYKKGMRKDGKNPLLLYGYGGFNISVIPHFSISRLSWMEKGGIVADANIRGGGEYGQKWHEEGIRLKKKNVFHDFISAAEFLIREGYTSKKFLAIEGGSNGGLLVGACITMRPDLFAVAFPKVGVLDMLHYHHFTAGAGWSYDYGIPEESKEMFDYLLSYSPAHNVKDTCYPATLVSTADHDDRVVPMHSYKFIAALQAHQQCKNVPVLIDIETKAGHGSGKSSRMIIEEEVKKWAFAWWNMGFRDISDIK